jgi:hypothetical protein
MHSHQLSPALVDQAGPNGEPDMLAADRVTVKPQAIRSSRRTVSGPPRPGGPMALLDAYHDLLKEAVQYASERGFFRSWGDDGLPQVKVYVGPRDESGRPAGLLVLQAQAAFDFAWRMYDWAMGQKRDAERARDGSLLTAPRRRTSALRRAN